MDHCQAKLNAMGQLHQECKSDLKSRFWQIGNHTVSRTEVIRPQPRRAARSFCSLDSLNRLGPMMKGILSMPRGDCGSEILDLICQTDSEDDLEGGDQTSFFWSMPREGDCGSEILDLICQDYSEDDLEGGDQASFFCGSPPVRTGNPVIKDPMFLKQNQYPGSPLGNHHGMKTRVERGSPSCGSSFGGSPKMRIEGFALA